MLCRKNLLYNITRKLQQSFKMFYFQISESKNEKNFFKEITQTNNKKLIANKGKGNAIKEAFTWVNQFQHYI